MLTITCLSMFVIPPTAADIGVPGEEYKMTMNMRGTITASGTCKFKERLTPIDFGEVYYSAMSGSNTLKDVATKELDAVMDCSEDYFGATNMVLTPGKGTVDYQGTKLMQVVDDSKGTVSKDLAIRLLVNSVSQNIGEDFAVDITQPSGPKLEVELVQIGNGKSFVSGATFSATATLTLNFL